MSDKKLLNESTIRRFMTLAGVQPLASTFISEQEESPPEEEAELASAEGGESIEGDMSMEPEVEEPPVDDEPMPEASISREQAQALVDLADQLRDDLDEPEGAPPEEEVELASVDDAEGDMAPPAEEDEEMEALEEILNNSSLEVVTEVDNTALINEVFKRVTKRIISERLK